MKNLQLFKVVKKMRKTWSDDEVKFLKKNYAKMSATELAKVMGKTASSIRSYVTNHGLGLGRINKRWPEKKDKVLRDMHARNTNAAIAKKLGISESAVSGRAFVLGLRKDTDWKLEMAKAGMFKKGNVSWNKGVKNPFVPSENMKRTMFKPGNKPTNTYEGVGHISTRKDKNGNTYKYIKLADSKWVPLHRKLWMDANGDVSKGMIVAFKDRDSMNCVLENLMLISRKENRIRNAGHSTLKDTYVAGLMARDGRRVVPALAAELVKIPELIELKRNNLKLNRYVKEQRRSGGTH